MAKDIIYMDFFGTDERYEIDYNDDLGLDRDFEIYEVAEFTSKEVVSFDDLTSNEIEQIRNKIRLIY